MYVIYKQKQKYLDQTNKKLSHTQYGYSHQIDADLCLPDSVVRVGVFLCPLHLSTYLIDTSRVAIELLCFVQRWYESCSRLVMRSRVFFFDVIFYLEHHSIWMHRRYGLSLYGSCVTWLQRVSLTDLSEQGCTSTGWWYFDWLLYGVLRLFYDWDGDYTVGQVIPNGTDFFISLPCLP